MEARRAETRNGAWFTTASPQGTPINADEKNSTRENHEYEGRPLKEEVFSSAVLLYPTSDFAHRSEVVPVTRQLGDKI
jgi:hypothetical protein